MLYFTRRWQLRWSHPEERLLDAVQSIQASQFSNAEKQLQALITDLPDFKLAQLVYADVLMAKTAALVQPGSGLPETKDKELLLSEIKNRYKAAADKQIEQKYPAVLARLDEHYNHAIAVDLTKSRLYVFNTENYTKSTLERTKKASSLV